MAAWKGTTDLEVNIEPFMSNGYGFRQIELSEKIGGKVGSGTIELWSDGSDNALKLVTEAYSIDIEIKKKVGTSYKILGFIDNKKYAKNLLTITFSCVPDRKFYTESTVLDWPDITNALQSLWPGKKDFRCESDINNNIKLYQTGESNLSLCTKLAYSFKKKSIFAFGLEGFMIKDLLGIDSTGNKEPYWTIVGDKDVYQDTSYNFNYNYKLYKQNVNPWEEDYAENESKNIQAQIIDSSYRLIHKNYYQLLDNYVYNKNIMNSRMYSAFKITHPETIPEYKIGDIVKYQRVEQTSDMPIKSFLVSSMDIFISTEPSQKDENGMQISVSSILRGIEEDGKIMPEDDPVK